MAIGMWGPKIVFRVSEKEVFTFTNLKRSAGSEWASHSRIGKKAQSEYLRPKVQQLKFTMSLDATLGVRPRATMELLEQYTETGEIYYFIVGCKMVGQNPWKITDLSEAWEVVYSRGELVKAKVDVTMEEYI